MAQKKWILFFDGDCGLCSRSVRFLSNADTHDAIWFAPLQGTTAAGFELTTYASLTDGSLVLRRESDGKIYLRSDASLEILRALGGWWKLLLIAKIIPHPLREAAYRWVARHRIDWFGHADTCSLPDPRLLKKLLP